MTRKQYSRMLSRMCRQDRLLARAIERTKKAVKNKFASAYLGGEDSQKIFDITPKNGSRKESKTLPKEWR